MAAQLGPADESPFVKPNYYSNDYIVFNHMDPYFRAQVALAQIISFRATNQLGAGSPADYNLWQDFYVPFWETMFRAYVKRNKARAPEVSKAIEEGYISALEGKKTYSVSDYANLLSAVGKLYDDLKYSSPEKENIESPFDCDLRKFWSL